MNTKPNPIIKILPTGKIDAVDISKLDDITNINNIPEKYLLDGLKLCRNRKNVVRYYKEKQLTNKDIKTIEDLIELIGKYKIKVSNKGQVIYDFRHSILNFKTLESFFLTRSFKLFKCLYVKDRKNNRYQWRYQLIQVNKELTQSDEKVISGFSQLIYQKQLLVKHKLITQKQLDVLKVSLKHNKISMVEFNEKLAEHIKLNWLESQ